MSEKIYNKLVRDKVPDVIRADNAEPVVRILDDTEYKKALLLKLIEEATELYELDGSLDERADVDEVLRKIDEVFGHSAIDIRAASLEKTRSRGGFNDRVFLEKIIYSQETNE